MKKTYQDPEENLDNMKLSMYCLPILGGILALTNLTKKEGDLKQKKLSRTSFTLLTVWFILYNILWLGSTITNDSLSLRLSYINGMLTTGYFFTCLVLMLRIWSRK